MENGGRAPLHCTAQHTQRPDTAVAAAAVAQTPSDGSPKLAVTYVLPRHMGRSAAESERVAAASAGHFFSSTKTPPGAGLSSHCGRNTEDTQGEAKPQVHNGRTGCKQEMCSTGQTTSHRILAMSNPGKDQGRLRRGNDFVDRSMGSIRPKYEDDAIDAYFVKVQSRGTWLFG